MRLEDICTVFTDGDWIESKDQSESGIRLVQTGNIGEGTYLEKEACIFRKNRALAPHERSAVPLGTDHCPVG